MENSIIISDLNCYLSVCNMLNMKVTKCKSLHGDVYMIYPCEDSGFQTNGIIIENKLYENSKVIFATDNIINHHFTDVLEGYIIDKEIWFIINKTAFIVSDWKLKGFKELIKDSIPDNTTFEQVQKVFSTSILLLLGITKKEGKRRSRLRDRFINLIKYNSSIYKTRFFGGLNNSNKQIIITMDRQLYLLSGTCDYYRLDLKDSDREHMRRLELLGNSIGTVINDNVFVFDDTIIDTKAQQIIILKSGEWNPYIKIDYLIQGIQSNVCYNILKGEVISDDILDNLIIQCKFKQKRLSEKEFIAELSNSAI